MSDIHTNRPGFLDESTFLVRITQHDGRAVEDALGGATLFDCGVRLRGGIVEATYAADEPPVLKRLREDGVPYIVEPQTVRFTSERFLRSDASIVCRTHRRRQLPLTRFRPRRPPN